VAEIKTGYRPDGALLGWTRDQPDFRDYTPDHPLISAMLERLPGPQDPGVLPVQADLRQYFLEGVRRTPLPLATASACTLLAEYFERRAHGKVAVRSPLFLCHMARRLSEPYGDTGTDIRTTLKALRHFGIPPEDHYPSSPERIGTAPDPFAAVLARRFRPVSYVRLDPRNTPGEETLERVRTFLAAGFPSVFGFSVPNSALLEPDVVDIPYRVAIDSVRGGQAAIAVGYDDRRLTATRGALLIYSPMGAAWDRPGYYWLPYRFVEQQLSVDFWTILRDDWIDSEEFERPRRLSARE
jgi:C1A family cysteine protease